MTTELRESPRRMKTSAGSRKIWLQSRRSSGCSMAANEALRPDPGMCCQAPGRVGSCPRRIASRYEPERLEERGEVHVGLARAEDGSQPDQPAAPVRDEHDVRPVALVIARQ